MALTDISWMSAFPPLLGESGLVLLTLSFVGPDPF
jgi:hypothetical protein